MALVREHAMYGGFDVAADACGGLEPYLGYGYGAHDALLDFDAAALFGGYASADLATLGAGGLVQQDGASWAGAAAVTSSSSSSVLTFDRAVRGHVDQQAAAESSECDAWIDAMDGVVTEAVPAPYRATTTVAFDAASGCLSLTSSERPAGRQFGLLFPSTSGASHDVVVGAEPAARGSLTKRPYVAAQGANSTHATKKQCGASRKTSKAKPAPTTPPKDPQSLAAKNRREKISERLRTLQELVPNGTKVDLVTMLEKAITYVKFLQLQVKVLATDEFWPAQGGMAPEISQVKEALDAILSSSQRGEMN